ncbi:arylsulfatase B-like [Rhipicephalus sanguineus]|uniref:arylsulfatase B-like n=1 Tax=Rhipicephalus sanguineus TaxID=34632 RepID=UPI0020C499DB|nr:arylsulfatase B-like [Rhipicephalus sanguineus]
MSCGVYMLMKAHRSVKKPHIIFILADDLGWADVSFHGSSQIPTPNIDALAADGVVLNNYYAHPICTASRAALMTGLYATRHGLQNRPIQPGEPFGLDLKYTLFPQHLKSLGYETHLIGKWHLGCYRHEYTPTRRGFDTFFGLYYGHGDYYTHMLESTEDAAITGLDFWNGTEPAWEANGLYSTDLYADKAVQLIGNLDKSKPQFIFLSHQAVHSGNDNNRLQAPAKNVDKFPYIGEYNRTIYVGMLDYLDMAIGRTFRAFAEAGMLEDSVIAFSSDNGGGYEGHLSSRGINWPLRGAKSSPWEGGDKVAAFVWSQLLQKRRWVSHRLMHITDWLPTLYGLAGGSVHQLGNIDGHDMWESLTKDAPSPRSELVYNIDPLWGYGAIRKDNFKIVVGAFPQQRLAVPGGERPQQDLDELVEQSYAGETLKTFYGLLKLEFMPDWRVNATLTCPEESLCDDERLQSPEHVYLFDLEEDPCDCNNLAYTHKELLESLNGTLEFYKAQTVAPLNLAVDPNSHPDLHNGTRAPWL